MKRNTVEFGTSVYITSLFCSGKKMGKLSERNRIVEIRKAQAGEPVAFMGVEDGRLEMLFYRRRSVVTDLAKACFSGRCGDPCGENIVN